MAKSCSPWSVSADFARVSWLLSLDAVAAQPESSISAGSEPTEFDAVAACARGRLSTALRRCFGSQSRHMVVLQWVSLCADLRNFGSRFELTPFMVSEYGSGCRHLAIFLCVPKLKFEHWYCL